MTTEIRIEFTSDWHIGSGRGQLGSVDALIARDSDDCPCIPAKSLTGILRDAAEDLASQLGNNWPGFVDELFGDQPGLGRVAHSERPRPALLSIRLAQLSPTVRELISGNSRTRPLARQLTTVRSSTSIDDRGVARDDTLRSIEVAPAGLELSASVRISEWAADPKTVEYFLAAAARLVEVIGGKRRRGLGRVRMRLWRNGKEIKPENDDWAKALPVSAPALRRSTDANTSFAIVPICTQLTHEGGVWIRLDILAMTPLLLASEIRGNQSTTNDYIGGNLLLPIVHQALERCGVDGSAAIRNGHLIVCRGLPAHDEERLKPAPFVFEQQKGNSGAPWRNRLIEQNTNSADVPPETFDYKQVRSGWIGERGARRTVTIEERAHNIIEDHTQSTGAAGIFTYRVVASGERFFADVWISDQLRETLGSASRLSDEIEGDHSVGRSKKDDYGRVEVTTTVLERPTAESVTARAPEGDQQIVLWCVSDVFLLDHKARSLTTAEDVLAATVQALELKVSLDVKRSFVRTRRIDSWSAAWSLPRPTLACVMAGSVIVAASSEPISLPSRVFVGERQAEGFGEIIVNNMLLTHAEVGTEAAPAAASRHGSRASRPSGGAQRANLTDSERRMLDDLVEAACLRSIDARAREVLEQEEDLKKIGWDKEKPKNSQIGKIRVFLHDLVAAADRQPLPKALERNLDQKVKARLTELIDDKEEVWRLLGEDALVLPGWPDEQKTELKSRFQLRALQMIIEVAHHRRTRGEVR
jgi:CRISPR-associated protein Csx10